MRSNARFLSVGLIVGLGLVPLASPASNASSGSTRSYAGETKERVIEAAKAVLTASDPKGFQFGDSLGGFTGYRGYSEYAVVVYTTARDKWNFEAETSGKSVRAAVSVVASGTRSGTFNSTSFEEPVATPALLRLFWDRVDYMLGKRADWVTCSQAGAADDVAALCGSGSGRDAPAPPALPRSGKQPRL